MEKFVKKNFFKRFPLALPIFFLLLLIGGFHGGLYHGLERGIGGWIAGGTVYYSYNYGESYSWEKNYDSLKGFWNGSFPETECGALRIDVFEWKTRQPEQSNKYVYTQTCGMLMSLEDFVRRYLQGVVVSELMVKSDLPSEQEQVTLFESWKSQGLLENIKYKNVTIYDWGNIKHSVIFAFLLPLLFAIAGTVILHIVWFFICELFFNLKSGRIQK